MRRAACWISVLGFLMVCGAGDSARAEAGRVLPDGKKPKDRRLAPLKNLNGDFPFHPPETATAWEKRSAALRRRVLVSTGLWPMPPRTPLNAVIHGRVQRKDFTVDRVFFESTPNHYVTGLLYRPKDSKGKNVQRPGVLCPHGHGGRLQDYGAEFEAKLAKGAEKHRASGRYPKLARCAQLARMGCVVFIFDMIGYADSVQITRKLAHRFQDPRPELDTPERWGFFSTQAELRMQSIMGLQTWNSLRALDFLCSLPDVDAARIGVTGGSGGGTQTIILGAIDSRPTAAFPQGMVSTSMQGGCTCENSCLLRIGTGNVELAALFAPRPQAMTAADDWTRGMMTKGYPPLKQLYTTLGVPQNVLCKPLLHFKHNYNYVTRAIMYSWFNKHLKLGLKEPIIEQDFKPLTPAEWTVWTREHPAPKAARDYEPRLLKAIAQRDDSLIAKTVPRKNGGAADYRRVVGGAFQTLIGRGLPEGDALDREKVQKHERVGYLEMRDLVRLKTHGEEIPIVSFFPKEKGWNKRVVIWIDGRGKAALFDAQGRASEPVQTLLDQGTAVVGADLFGLGEFQSDGQPAAENRTVKTVRAFAGYTYTYNHPLFAQRVHDILTLIAWVRSDEHAPERVDLAGVEGAGPWVAAARAIAGDQVDRAAIDTEGFRFRDLKSYRDIQFLPGAVKYGDLPALLALNAPLPLWVAGEKAATPAIAQAVYAAEGNAKALESVAAKNAAVEAARWLAK